MSAYVEELIVKSRSGNVRFLDITTDIKKSIKKSGIIKGHCLVQALDTSCSIIFEKHAHNHEFNRESYLQGDLNNMFAKLMPEELLEKNKGHYTEQEQLAYLKSLDTVANALGPTDSQMEDASLRAALVGRSQTFSVDDNSLGIDSGSAIYFVDFALQRILEPKCQVVITAEQA